MADPRISTPPLSFIERHKIRNILIVKLTSLGDVVHALPVAASLKKAFPFLRLHWVVEDRCAPLLENHPLLDSVIIYPRKKIQALLLQGRWPAGFALLADLQSTLKRLSIDLSLDLQGLAKSAMMVWMARAPHRFGCFGLKEFSYLLSKGQREGGDLHAVERNLKVAEFLGAGKGEPAFSLGLSEEEKNWAEDYLRGQGVSEETPLIGMQVGASFPQKCWPISKWVTLMEQIAKIPRIRIILLGDQNDRDRLTPFTSRISPEVMNTVGTLTLRQLMALIHRCQLFVGADTGPLHIAVGLGVTVIALCGADDPKWTGPYGPNHRIHYKAMPCSPCNKTPVCQGRYDCMQAIEVEEILESLQALMPMASF
jgi:heptosyltransferase-1